MIELVNLRLAHPVRDEMLVNRGNLCISSGEVGVVIAGAGCGSTHLLRAMLSETPVADGEIRLFGANPQTMRRSSLRNLRRKVGLVPQKLFLLEDRSAVLNVALPLEIDGVPRSYAIRRAEAALLEVGLSSEASLPVECLPSSARQLVAVARAIVRQPDILLFDQPTNRQDSEGTTLVANIIQQAATRGAAVLVTTRDGALRDIAEARSWSQWYLAGGSLHSAAEVALDGAAIDELLVLAESAPVRAPRTEPRLAVPAFATFPISTKTASAQ